MERPQTVTGLGILNIAFGALGLVAVLYSRATPETGQPIATQMLAALHATPAYVTWMNYFNPLSLLASAVAITAGIGLLQLKSWARKLSIGYACWSIAAALAYGVVAWVYLAPPLLEQAETVSGPAAWMIKVFGYTIKFGGVAGLIYPTLLIYFMTRPHVKRALEPMAGPPVLPRA